MKRNSNSRVLRKLVTFLSLLTCSFLFLPGIGQTAGEPITYLSQKNAEISALLIPDPTPGQVPTVQNGTTILTVDQENLPFSTKRQGDSQVQISGKILDISEGQHTASIQTIAPDKSVKDQKKMLFVLDLIPPDIKLIEPKSIKDNAAILNNLIFKITDTGSGIDLDPDNSIIESLIDGRPAAVNGLYYDKNQLYLSVSALPADSVCTQESCWYGFGKNVQVSIKIQDRAGNIAT